MSSSIYKLTLQKTYYKQGFFNLGVGVDNQVRSNNGPIKLLLGESKEEVLGIVNRNANRNGTPRILVGARLRNWFEQNFKVMDIVEVVVINPNELWLRSPKDKTNNFRVVPTQSPSIRIGPEIKKEKVISTEADIEPSGLSLKAIIDIGFEDVGEWYLDRSGFLQYKLTKYMDEQNILYAFIVQGKVMYIGKSTQTLDKRMSGYKKPGPSQLTNIDKNKRIKELLGNRVDVKVFAFIPKEQILYRGTPINIAAGLEDTLIAKVRPPWNNQGNK